MRVGIIVLAAGGSSRLGSPKQLLSYRGQTLVRRATETALRSIATQVVVVIGSRAKQVREELNGLPVSIVENGNWQAGMSTSIYAGLEVLSPHDLDGVVMMLCDQPFVTTDLLNLLVARYQQTSRPIVASRYQETCGVPAFFSRALFPELASLTAEEGARRIILKHPELVATVNFPPASIDIDTPDDREQLVSTKIFRRPAASMPSEHEAMPSSLLPSS